MKGTPLVSVGIPTYNRPEGLRRTLECMTQQTYPNLEIIISDNCSSNEEVRKVLEEFKNKDARVHYFRQNENIGAGNNFKFVLRQATGEYFMWAADDDEWELTYVEKIINFFSSSNKHYIAVNLEAQYVDKNNLKFPFFSEGKPFYNFYSDSKIKRLQFMLAFNYGDLFYSIYRTKYLKESEIIFVENEIPFLLQIASKGNWKVLSEVGFYKQTNQITYRQASWEKQGGILPDSSFSISYYKSLKSSYTYHKIALANIRKAIKSLDLGKKDALFLYSLSYFYIYRHLLFFIIRYKPAPF